MTKMEQRTRRKLANRLITYCRKHATEAHNTYQFSRRVVVDADGTEHDQVLFSDSFVLLDVTHLMDVVLEYHPHADPSVDIGHWHDPNASAPDFRRIDLARAWDAWSAAKPVDTLEAMNLYTYHQDGLCQWFYVMGSQNDGDPYTRRVLINTTFLRLMIPERAELCHEYVFAMAADGHVRVEDDVSGATLGYVMPLVSSVEKAGRHAGQMKACHTCGGDGDWRGLAATVDASEAATA